MNGNYKQPSHALTPKAAGSVIGAATGMFALDSVLIWVADQFGLTIPVDVAEAVTVVVFTLLGAWLPPERKQGA